MDPLKICIPAARLQQAAAAGDFDFLRTLADRCLEELGGELNAENMGALNAEQISLIAYLMFRNEALEGGFVQLIHNGYGPFFFFNPFAKTMRLMGAPDFAKLINKAKKLFVKYEDKIAADCTDEEFMALYEKFPAFDELDDAFVEMEESVTAALARYVKDHIELFAEATNE